MKFNFHNKKKMSFYPLNLFFKNDYLKSGAGKDGGALKSQWRE